MADWEADVFEDMSPEMVRYIKDTMLSSMGPEMFENMTPENKQYMKDTIRRTMPDFLPPGMMNAAMNGGHISSGPKHEVHKAVLLGNVGKIQRLLKAGEDVDRRDETTGTTTLHLAAQCGDTEVRIRK